MQAPIKSAQWVNNSISLYDPNEPDLFANAGRYMERPGERRLAVMMGAGEIV